MPYTQQDLDNIKAAIASGEQEVELEGKRVKMFGMSDLLRAKNQIEAELNNLGIVESTRLRTTYTAFNKG